MKKLNEAEKATITYCSCIMAMMILFKSFRGLQYSWELVVFAPIITALIIFSIQRGIRNYFEKKDAKIKAEKEYQEFLQNVGKGGIVPPQEDEIIIDTLKEMIDEAFNSIPKELFEREKQIEANRQKIVKLFKSLDLGIEFTPEKETGWSIYGEIKRGDFILHITIHREAILLGTNKSERKLRISISDVLNAGSPPMYLLHSIEEVIYY